VAVDSVRQGTVSADIAQLAAALMARHRQPVQTLQTRRDDLSLRSTVLSTLKTKLVALNGQLDRLAGTGTLSPFAAKTASSSDAAVLTAAASASAPDATLGIVVGQLARRATHVSDRFTDDATTIASGGTGTYEFTVRIGSIDHAVSVDVAAGETDEAVLDTVAAAITAAVGSAGSAVRLATESGRSRLSVASATSGTSNKVVFTDTDGLLGRLGLVHASATAATDTTGGYLYEDLGNHELDARLVVDGLTYYRESNTVSDLVSGVTFTLKAPSTSEVTVRLQPDADHAVAALEEFIARYNDVLDYLGQQTFVDGKNNRRGILALDPVFSGLAGQLRTRAAAHVASQADGDVDGLAVLGLGIGADGKLSIKNGAELRDTIRRDPAAVANLFNATDGIATTLETFVNGFARATGTIAATQNQLTSRIEGLDDRIERMNAALAVRQARLEQDLARSQALLTNFSRQAAQINAFLGVV
jgi:flagellar hook-associated protein 2